MTRARLSDIWVRRGDAWDKLQGADRSLSEAISLATDNALRIQLQDARGCLQGVAELLARATGRIEHLASQLSLNGEETGHGE